MHFWELLEMVSQVFSKWLACELNMNLCIIKQKIYQAGSFASLMEHCPENSIIVIEDFDTLFDIEKREEDDDVPKKRVRKKNTITFIT